MNTTRFCKSCGTPLPVDAPEGLCPKCLLQQGVGGSQGESASADPLTEWEIANYAAGQPEERAGNPINR